MGLTPVKDKKVEFCNEEQVLWTSRIPDVWYLISPRLPLCEYYDLCGWWLWAIYLMIMSMLSTFFDVVVTETTSTIKTHLGVRVSKLKTRFKQPERGLGTLRHLWLRWRQSLFLKLLISVGCYLLTKDTVKWQSPTNAFLNIYTISLL